MNQKIIMTTRELSRYEIIKQLIKGQINGTEAAKQINLSKRQVRRLKSAVKKRDVKGIIHGNRGKESNRKISEDKTKTIKAIVKEKYPDFGPTFAAEKLDDIHGIKIGKETLRLLMIDWKLWSLKPRKKNKEYRTWRPRKENYGEMEQFDGSYHKWFEEKAPECCLLASIDDATGCITEAQFSDNESVLSVFGFWKDYINKNGKPVSIYLDKYSTYKVNHKSAVDNSELLTQFQRAARELDIRLITAHSPEAKGRIERLFGTLQDRLVKEMRLRNISDKETANKFLKDEYIPWFNQKFGVIAVKKNNLHQRISAEEQKQLEAIFAVHSERQINNDFTIRFKNQWFQLEEIQPTLVLRTDKVLVEERLDGSIWLRLSARGGSASGGKEKYLNYFVLPERPKKIVMKLRVLTRTKSPWKPPANHPWRRSFLYQKQIFRATKNETTLQV